jgi:hypothetical protein
MLYLAGPAFALLIAAALMWVSSLLPDTSSRNVARVAPALPLLLIPIFLLTLYHVDLESRDDTQNRAFAEQLRTTVADVPDGGTLYIRGAPMNLVVFDQSRLDALVELYYGTADVEPATKSPPPASLQDGDRYFDFRP